jgi:hypothetical protein
MSFKSTAAAAALVAVLDIKHLVHCLAARKLNQL